MGVYVYKWGIEKDFEKRENSLPVKNIDKFDYITIKKVFKNNPVHDNG